MGSELAHRGVKKDKNIVLPNAPDFQEQLAVPTESLAQRSCEIRHSLGIAADAIVIGFAGTLSVYEGLTILPEIASSLSGTFEKLHLFIMDDGEQKTLLQHRISCFPNILANFADVLPYQ
jgi:hypothetical protein